MGKQERKATWQLKCIAALPHNHHFRRQVEEIQQIYSIPVGDKGIEWFVEQLHEHSNGKWASALFADKDEQPFFAYWAGRHIADTRVPIEREVVILLGRFQLPDYVFYNLLQYILTGDEVWLDLYAIRPKVRFDLDVRVGGTVNLTITGLSRWTTGEQWKMIWDSEVRQRLKKEQEILGMAPPGKKRATLESFREEMKRYSQWYQLCDIQGYSAVKALNKWEKDHPEEVDPDNPIDPSTVTRAVKEFKQIISPVPIK